MTETCCRQNKLARDHTKKGVRANEEEHLEGEVVKLQSTSGAGEIVETDYIRVTFQKGFPSKVGINGCRVQDVVAIAMDRLEEYQKGPLACEENEDALHHLHAAVQALQSRIRRRQEQGVLNTMTPHENTRTEDEEDDFSATGS
jgi:hypothetical protein